MARPPLPHGPSSAIASTSRSDSEPTFNITTDRRRIDRELRVLVIEPDPAYGELIVDSLARASYLPTLALSAAEGVKRMRLAAHQLVIIDAAGHVERAIKAAQQLRQLRSDIGLIFTAA